MIEVCQSIIVLDSIPIGGILEFKRMEPSGGSQ